MRRRSSPAATPTWLDRGQALEAKGERRAALADFDQVIRLEPDSIDALSHRAFLRQATGDYEGAASDYGRVVALAPDDPRARRGRGFAELSAKHYDAAIADLTEAIKRNPQDALAYRFRSQAYAAEHDSQHATSDDENWQRLTRGR